VPRSDGSLIRLNAARRHARRDTPLLHEDDEVEGEAVAGRENGRVSLDDRVQLVEHVRPGRVGELARRDLDQRYAETPDVCLDAVAGGLGSDSLGL